MSATEIAAKALYDHEPEMCNDEPVPWVRLHEHVREYYRAKARAVLMALQGTMLQQWGKYLDYLEMDQQIQIARRHYTESPMLEYRDTHTLVREFMEDETR